MSFKTITRTVPQPPIPQPDKVERVFTVEMTADEVIAAKTVAMFVGGDPKNTLRGGIESLAAKLPTVAQAYQYDATNFQNGSIYFQNGSKGVGYVRAVAALNRLPALPA